MILDEIVRTYESGDRGITHLLAAKNGRIIAEWYRHPVGRNSPHMLHSAAKSFISTGIGMALDEGKLSLDDKLVDYLSPAQRATAVPGIEDITIAHMLTMRTGHKAGTSGVAWRKLPTSWVDDYLQIPITGTPGKDFIYSSGTSHMLSMVLQKATGLPADEYLAPRLFAPLDFDFITWDRDPDGICSGGNGLTINIADFLKWGQLYLNGGEWNGQRILPASWVADSLRRHVDVGGLVWTGDGYGAADEVVPGEGEGYGLQIWHREGGNYASGIFGQYCVIVPESNTVVAVYSSLRSKDADPLSETIINGVRSEEFASFTAPVTSGFALSDAPGDSAVISAAVAGTFASEDGRTRLSFSLTDPSGAEGGNASTGTVSASMSTGSDGDASLARPASTAVLAVTGTDATGEVEFSAGLGHDHWFEGPLGAPSLHHSYNKPTQAFGHLRRRGPWALEIKVVYPVTPFVDRLTIEVLSDGRLRYGRTVNVNSQDTSIDEVVLTRVED